jgi:hypothetical protein
MIKLQHMDSGDKQFLLGAVLAPILAWWFFQGRKKYATKGMK